MAYFEWVELESFFSGYLLVYAIFYLLASNRPATNFVKSKLLQKLPLAYALVGTFYWGLQLKNLYPDYHGNLLISDLHLHYLRVWGLLSIFFWLPPLHKRAVFSQLHSLIFFFLLMKDIYLNHFTTSGGSNDARNNIKIFSVSILLNLAAVFLVVLIGILMAHLKSRKKSTPV